ncbi:MAG: hypothetical protein AAF497_24300 [Planctomycetota bacterium]
MLSWQSDKSTLNAEIANELPDLSKHDPPEKIVAVWSDTTFSKPGSGITRGLGGRLYFYDQNRKAVPVNGQLIVYGFDDSKPGASNRPPERRYVITPKEFQSHQSKTDIGPSYSVWIPWDKLGPQHAKISIVPVFTTIEGKVIMGDHSRHVLPGTSSNSLPMDSAPAATAKSSVELASYSDVASAAGKPLTTREALTREAARIAATERLRATRIGLPPSVQNRLKQSNAAAVPQTELMLKRREELRANRVVTTRRGTSDALATRNNQNQTSIVAGQIASQTMGTPSFGAGASTAGQPGQVVPSDLARPIPNRWPGSQMPRPDRSGLRPPQVPTSPTSTLNGGQIPNQRLPSGQASGPVETSVYYGRRE